MPVFSKEKEKWKTSNAHKLINNAKTSKNAIRANNSLLSATAKRQENKTANNGLFLFLE